MSSMAGKDQFLPALPGQQGLEQRGRGAGTPYPPWQDPLEPVWPSAWVPSSTGSTLGACSAPARDFTRRAQCSVLMLCPGSQTAAGTRGWLCLHGAFLIPAKAPESQDSAESSSEQLSLASAFPLKAAYCCPGCEKSWLAQSFPIEK